MSGISKLGSEVQTSRQGRAFYLRHGWDDRGIEDYPARVEGSTAPVPVWRMTKRLQVSVA